MSEEGPGPSHSEEEIKFNVDPGEDICFFQSFKARDEVFVAQNKDLFNYSLGGKRTSFKSPRDGIIRFNKELLKDKNPLKQGDVIGWIGGECRHEIVLNSVCVICCQVQEKKDEGECSYVSMVHNKPGLMVSKKKATEIAEDFRKRLLEAKKMILMVDLDQTLIHTTNRKPTPEENVNLFTYAIQNCFYHTKMRPHALEFLDSCAQLFEMHVCTYGKREYAEKIVSLIDPEKKYFGDRVLTRDELRSQHNKGANLSDLFPNGEEMVLMVDDRCDVWGFSNALVWIKPYVFFNDVGDINDPSLFQKATQPENEDSEAKPAEPPATHPDEADDDVLLSALVVLKTIRDKFFEEYEKTQKILDAKDLAYTYRLTVLKGEVIVFSGLPKYGDGRKHQLVSCAEAFGAIVQDEIGDKTTVLVAICYPTQKYLDAKKRNLPIVNERWVEDSAVNWKNMAKEKYFEREIKVKSVPCRLPQESKEMAEDPILKRDDIALMDAEVDAEMEGLDDEEEDEPEEDNPYVEQSNEDEEGNRKRNLGDEEDDNEEDGDESSTKQARLDNESDESSEDEMAADLENLLGNIS